MPRAAKKRHNATAHVHVELSRSVREKTKRIRNGLEYRRNTYIWTCLEETILSRCSHLIRQSADMQNSSSSLILAVAATTINKCTYSKSVRLPTTNAIELYEA